MPVGEGQPCGLRQASEVRADYGIRRAACQAGLPESWLATDATGSWRLSPRLRGGRSRRVLSFDGLRCRDLDELSIARIVRHGGERGFASEPCSGSSFCVDVNENWTHGRQAFRVLRGRPHRSGPQLIEQDRPVRPLVGKPRARRRPIAPAERGFPADPARLERAATLASRGLGAPLPGRRTLGGFGLRVDRRVGRRRLI